MKDFFCHSWSETSPFIIFFSNKVVYSTLIRVYLCFFVFCCKLARTCLVIDLLQLIVVSMDSYYRPFATCFIANSLRLIVVMMINFFMGFHINVRQSSINHFKFLTLLILCY